MDFRQRLLAGGMAVALAAIGLGGNDSVRGSRATGAPTSTAARDAADVSPPAAAPAEPAEPPRETTDGPEGEDLDVSPARLESARPEMIRAVLSDAIERAGRDRGLRVGPGVVDAAADGSVRVIFGAESTGDAAQLARTLDSGGLAASVEDLRLFPLLGHGAAKLSPGALLNLIRATSTPQIELDGVHRPSLLESVPQIRADAAQAAGWDGDGVAVAVIDTGVDVDHPMFGSRVIEEACFSQGQDCPNAASQMLGGGAAEPCPFAGCDHGTHVAGVAVGDAESGPLVGVAPHAQLIAINVFSEIDGEAGAYTSDILAAMQHVLGLAAFHDIAAVNLSLGGELFTSAQACDQASPSQVSAVNRLRNAGIATVAASGNDGLTNAIASPACLSKVIGVGSVGASDAVSTFSNSADFLTLLAPGEQIQSAAPGGGTRNGSGTSMATPHVTGAIAALRETRPQASVDELENALVLSGQPILDTRNGITLARLRVDDASDLLEAAGPPSGGGGSPSDPSGGGSGNPAETGTGGGGGGGCGLVGVEPFLVLALARRIRGRSARMRPRGGQRPMSVHGEYGRALRGVIERLSECEELVDRDWPAALEQAQPRPDRDLSSAARAALALLARLDAQLALPGAAGARAIPPALEKERLERLRDACHHLRAHCHAILGAEPAGR